MIYDMYIICAWLHPQRRGLFQQARDALDEDRRVVAVDEAVIEGRGQSQQLADDQLAVASELDGSHTYVGGADSDIINFSGLTSGINTNYNLSTGQAIVGPVVTSMGPR